MVKRTSALQAMIIFGLASGGLTQSHSVVIPSDYPYRPAFISTASAPTGHTELVIFPYRGKALKVPVRSIASPIRYGPDGKALFGQCTVHRERTEEPTRVAICKLELDSNNAIPVPGSSGMYIRDLAVSKLEQRVLISGTHRQEVDIGGLFEITLPDGNLRPIFTELSRDRFIRLSLSPDGKRAVATRKGQLELIDISRGTSEPLGKEFFMAAWSPDGKWLAALEMGEHGRTILMDSESLARRRILGHTEGDWSPDSRYLLGLKPCDEYYGTLEAINVETGERTTIQSSTCQVNQGTTGWVSSEIAEK